MFRRLIPEEYMHVEETDEHILYIRYVGKKTYADGTADIIRRPVDTNNVPRMSKDMALNGHVLSSGVNCRCDSPSS